MLWVKDVRGGRVVDDDCVLEISANLRQILHKLVKAINQGLTQDIPLRSFPGDCNSFRGKPVVHNAVNVELVEQRITVLHLLALNIYGTAIGIPWRRMQ
jgi:hypothetical protein